MVTRAEQAGIPGDAAVGATEAASAAGYAIQFKKSGKTLK